LIFVGANDGMMHAIDGRTGVEVWAFIPFNLLPKLRTLRDGQPIDGFDYFVDSSAKIADVRVDGQWRTVAVFGQGAGGTFYQAFDVSLDGIESSIRPRFRLRDDAARLLRGFREDAASLGRSRATRDSIPRSARQQHLSAISTRPRRPTRRPWDRPGRIQPSGRS
jgi:hypothetical protein